jgi:protein-tyrosine phosphatase
VNSEILDNINSGRCHTLADTDYVLTEYSFTTEFSYIKEYTGRLLSCGYIPIIAHAERYGCFAKKPELTSEIAAMGAMIQVNADSILGIDGNALKKTCKKLLKKRLAHIVASDAHGTKERMSHMHECCQYVSKKYGEDYARELFFENAMRIIQEAED